MTLSNSQIELIIRLLVEYQEETWDLSQAEWAEAQSALDTLDFWLEEAANG